MSVVANREGGPGAGRSGPGAPRSRSRAAGRVSAALWRRPWLRALFTLSPPLLWFLVIYLASLVLMLITAFWTVNPL
ncbi:MAG TPA: hypothetical protein VGG87_07490, partial [Solirubrobacteraceae bacterium]